MTALAALLVVVVMVLLGWWWSAPGAVIMALFQIGAVWKGRTGRSPHTGYLWGALVGTIFMLLAAMLLFTRPVAIGARHGFDSPTGNAGKTVPAFAVSFEVITTAW